MKRRRNPFQELYVTESIGSEKFVKLFSPLLVDHALQLFQPGHFILKGLPGSGKSMLLSLLKPSVRKSYYTENIDFPVPKDFNKFIGAGINLRRSGVSDFGQRPIEDKNSFKVSPYYFADYLNYFVVLDILNSIDTLTTPDCNLGEDIGIDNSPLTLNSFSNRFKKEGCWANYLDEVLDYQDLKAHLIERLKIYRSFLNYSKNEIPKNIKESKTIIGEPIATCARILRDSGVISKDTEIYVRIDQYEELAWLEDQPNVIGESFQEMIHKLLGMRDNSVSYKIGTRHFTWNDGAKMFGTSARLEKLRNYDEISIDTVLKRKENIKTWIFPDFAENILKRRIDLVNERVKNPKEKFLDDIFGQSIKPIEQALRYLKNNRTTAIKLEENWPKEWKKFLINLAEDNPFSARLAEAWCRQQGTNKRDVMTNIPHEPPYPWDSTWWKKERTEQALMQIASRNRQNLEWYGKQDILSLSGSNIFVFLWICRSIWNVWIRDNRNVDTEDTIETIDYDIQTIGIIEASDSWYYNKMVEFKGGKDRQLFVHNVGSMFYKKLINDIAMSNPGHNGFSIALEDLNINEEIKIFLDEATAYGDLYDAPHTSKLNDKKKRRKWYLNPILSPHFRIPVVHTKEPIYLTTREIRKWLASLKKSTNKDFGLGTEESNNINQISFDFEKK